MIHRSISIADFTYELPDEKIAKFPLQNRDASKLLVFSNDKVTDQTFVDLPNWLHTNDLLIFNNSRVIEARLIFNKSTGASIEIFLLEPANHQLHMGQAMVMSSSVTMYCLVGGASRWKEPLILTKTADYRGQALTLTAQRLGSFKDGFLIKFCWSIPDIPFVEVLHTMGFIPIPPYLKRKATEEDAQRYQTLFASQDGSVAAPTAALHFTNRVLQALAHQGVQTGYITLHVGAGTFKPVTAKSMGEHQMHQEYFEVNVDLLKQLIAATGSVIAVGTTSLRTLESLYWLGVKIKQHPWESGDQAQIDQWEVYDPAVQSTYSRQEALTSLLHWMLQKKLDKLVAKTSILILPGYSFKVCQGLVTNFHQPNSTLLLLVAALVGNQWQHIYQHALQNDYRFLSYGDASLLLPSGLNGDR